MNYSPTLINVDNIIFYTEGNACGIIAIPVIETTLENDYIHVFHDLSKQYIYGHLISKLDGSEGTIQIII